MEIKNENVSALDANGNVIKDIDVTVEGTITESKDGKTEVSKRATVNLNETAEGAISKLDGLKLKITAVPGQATDVQLLSTQWMQLKDIETQNSKRYQSRFELTDIISCDTDKRFNNHI